MKMTAGQATPEWVFFVPDKEMPACSCSSPWSMTAVLALLLLLGAALLWWGRHPCPVSLVEQAPSWTEDYATAQQHLPGCPAQPPSLPTCTNGETRQWSYYPAPVDTGGDTAVCIRNKNDPKNAWAQDTSYDQWCAQQSLPCPYPQCIKSGSSISGSTEDTPKPKPTPTWAPSTPVCPLCHVGGAVTKSYTVTAQPYCIDKKSGFPLEESLCTATKPHPAHTKCPAVDKCIYVPVPNTMLGFYYFVGDCPSAAANVPAGMLTSGNTIFASFVTGPFNQLPAAIRTAVSTIKASHPSMCVMISVGGQLGSTSASMYEYLSTQDEETIVMDIMAWPGDGIDWDIEPPSQGPALKYSQGSMPAKLASISSKVRKLHKNVTFAGFGSWVWDSSMKPLYSALIPVTQKQGIMVYPPAQGNANSLTNASTGYVTTNWTSGKNNATKASRSMLAGGISGNATVDEATQIAAAYKSAGLSSIIVWMVKPDQCSNTTGWTADNTTLASWTAVLDALS